MDILPQRQVHLDFHTSGAINGIGSMFDKEQFKRCLKKGHVNSITIFAKCHHGWAYFPSKTNQMHPGLNFDLLSSMLEACSEANVAAPIYISAGFDEKYAVEHPDHLHAWNRDYKHAPIKEKDGAKYFEGEANYHLLCMNSPYLDELKAQVEEVVEKFNPVGIFLDIVAPRVCYCKYCKSLMVKQGFDYNSDKDVAAFGEITYKKYYDTINNAAKAIKPEVRIFHNGGHITCGKRNLAHANTHLELESLPTGGWGYDHFPKSSRYVSLLGMEYLGMTGKFHLSWGEFGGFKHPNALRYEAALSLANGAKISVGDQMHPYGFLDDATYELIGNAFKYAESIEEYCVNVNSIADIGIISAEGYTEGQETNSLSDIGVCRILLEGKYLYDILDAECDFSKYKVLILPDKIVLKGNLGEKIKKFVSDGGKLLCSGTSGLDEKGSFVFNFGVKHLGKSEYKPSYLRPDYKALGLTEASYVMYSDMYNTELTDKNASVIAYSRNPFFNRTPAKYCSHKHTPFENKDNAPGAVVGKDGGYIAWNIFSEYAEVGSIILKEIVCKTIDTILSDNKTLTTNLPAQGVVTLMKQSNREVLHALYATPTKRGNNVEIIEDLVPIYNTEFSIKTDNVKSVTVVPENKVLDYTYENRTLKFSIDKFTCSTVIVIEH